MPRPFAALLSAACDASGLSYEAIADHLHLSRQSVWEWARDKHVPAPSRQAEIVQTLSALLTQRQAASAESQRQLAAYTP